jgi:hypothetical protein
MVDPKEPTPAECEANAKVFEDADSVGYAIWYPQMGGYCGMAVAVFPKTFQADRDDPPDACFDAYVWHDGDFPFKEGDGPPVRVHHCSAEQFVEFGNTLLGLMRRQVVGASADS